MASEKPLPKVAILSIGDMGAGIARLLLAHSFPVATNVSNRSKDTQQRAAEAGITTLFKDDLALVDWADVVLSVVPPADAAATAQRVVDALAFSKTHQRGESSSSTLYYADMNAVSPATCRDVAAMFARARAPVVFIDGCILGGPPKPPAAETASQDAAAPKTWKVPLCPTSGPSSLADVHPLLQSTLNARPISADVGAASGLKMCFASLSKGFSAIAVQAFTTAHRLGVLGDLKSALEELAPAKLKQAEGAVTGMPPKAYRWVREMEEISNTHSVDGGFGPELFAGAAGVFKAVAQDTVLGQEKIGSRKRGMTVEDVAEAMSEGMDKKRKKTE
ncbi:6-phosphogluconate dehydrogenase [Pyricularia oryzae 70-15]|uniref:6-phosphogluconate dehydrogenase n=3 Tax=Pyricularia oryzae TaxID=318829 RepID=G4MKM2_PYRO7|nr:6-phosphogluconate dehydrogenase [Pyricularia oryzae 70-15]EHA58405.1 6-phosphogluconate dehydrogenase [Pyricularia oryzae 70-15]ELQ44737.1 6-phosphogluconate dehydrogenase [Pyricularia oryzae Y34]KAI7913003.1 6-phosphogluconate dehydrogenase [Pyricularia oryzae]KAI7914754.1 6-phosphogluconate dehydrogenase [Pyricularia oryzae]